MSDPLFLRPCPFCGSTDTHWTHCMEQAHVVCEGCDTAGPDFESCGEFGDGAENLWNTRPIEDALLAACEVALGELRAIQRGQKASIGSIENTYTPQLAVRRIDAAAEQLRAAIAKARGEA